MPVSKVVRATIPTSGRSSKGALRPGARGDRDGLAQLVEMAGSGRLSLVFGARDTEHNNAVALGGYLERGEPKREPAPQGLPRAQARRRAWRGRERSVA